MTFEEFVGPGSMVCGLGLVEDVEGVELCDVARANALADGWQVAELPEIGVTLHAYQGDSAVSLVAIATEKPGQPAVGCYEGLCLWVDRRWRGRGLGTRLVVETARLRGGSPVEGAPAVAFSQSGWAAHRRAYAELYPAAIAG